MPASPTERTDLVARVAKLLDAGLTRQRLRLDAIDEDLSPVLDALQALLLVGGKRLRPAFAYWGWRAAGAADGEEIVAAASALEWLHASALIHDDVIDGSATRRGGPSVHCRFAALHREQQWRGDADAFGRAMAILVGDICLVWADEAYTGSGLPAEAVLRAQRVYDDMRTEVMAGQYLDVLAQAVGDHSTERAMQVARFKTAKYTVERPLHLGATLAGAGPALLAVLSAYGLPLGEAFQLRDDVLGVFGDPARTGKPAGDDLREGKRTVLVALALEAATPEQAALLDSRIGDPTLDDAAVAEIRDTIAATGAVKQVEAMIGDLTQRALAALDGADLPAEAAVALRELAVAATDRRR